MVHRIFQMESFARSGETLLMRALNAHPKIAIVSQLYERDDPRDIALHKRLSSNGRHKLKPGDVHLAHRNLEVDTTLLLKSATWIDHFRRPGFILVRNPFSVVKSSYVLLSRPDAANLRKRQLLRWARRIDRNMVGHIREVDNLTAICSLYSRKMLHAYNTGLPIVHYERFVAEPEAVLRKLIKHMGLKWHDSMLCAHEQYHPGDIGHGRIKLWEPIHGDSVHKYTAIDPHTLDRICELTGPVLDAYGYTLENGRVSIRSGFDDRFAGSAVRFLAQYARRMTMQNTMVIRVSRTAASLARLLSHGGLDDRDRKEERTR